MIEANFVKIESSGSRVPANIIVAMRMAETSTRISCVFSDRCSARELRRVTDLVTRLRVNRRRRPEMAIDN